MNDDWLGDWWEKERTPTPPEDPGYPAYYGTCTGAPTPAPISFALSSRERTPSVINLDKLNRRVYALLGAPLT